MRREVAQFTERGGGEQREATSMAADVRICKVVLESHASEFFHGARAGAATASLLRLGRQLLDVLEHGFNGRTRGRCSFSGGGGVKVFVFAMVREEESGDGVSKNWATVEAVARPRNEALFAL